LTGFEALIRVRIYKNICLNRSQQSTGKKRSKMATPGERAQVMYSNTIGFTAILTINSLLSIFASYSPEAKLAPTCYWQVTHLRWQTVVLMLSLGRYFCSIWRTHASFHLDASARREKMAVPKSKSTVSPDIPHPRM
jgi:hypothetical protein